MAGAPMTSIYSPSTATSTSSWAKTRRRTFSLPSRRHSVTLRRTAPKLHIPARIDDETGRYSLVDGIPFELPVASHHSPALMAAYTIDAESAAELLPGRELYPLRLPGGRGVLMITVIDYTSTNIGRYIEFSIAIAVTHGRRPAPPLVALLFSRHYDLGQICLRPAGELGNLGQGRQGYLGHGQAPGEP